MNLVLDASVALKWFFRERPDEEDCDRAVEILVALGDGRVQLIQPTHFLAEMAAVLAREKPDEAETDLADLIEVGFRTSSEFSHYLTALELAIRYRHHLFDTLYHAIALNSRDALLVTADDRYFNKAKGEGRIVLLSHFDLD